MKLRTRTKLAIALIAGTGLALALPALAAVGQSSPSFSGVQLVGTGVLADRGAVVSVPVLISCPAGDEPGLSVNLTERSGSGVTQGFGSPVGLTCTGGIQQITVTVSASTRPFVQGTAFGQVEMFLCDPFLGCTQTGDVRNVRLTKK